MYSSLLSINFGTALRCRYGRLPVHSSCNICWSRSWSCRCWDRWGLFWFWWMTSCISFRGKRQGNLWLYSFEKHISLLPQKLHLFRTQLSFERKELRLYLSRSSWLWLLVALAHYFDCLFVCLLHLLQSLSFFLLVFFVFKERLSCKFIDISLRYSWMSKLSQEKFVWIDKAIVD